MTFQDAFEKSVFISARFIPLFMLNLERTYNDNNVLFQND